MSLMLSVIINKQASPLKERKGPDFSEIAIIDPLGLYRTEDDYLPKLFQDVSLFKPEILGLFLSTERVMGLFQNSQELRAIAGEHQIVVLDKLDLALREVPRMPVALDIVRSKHPEPLGLLMSFRLEEAYPSAPFLHIGLGFYETPERFYHPEYGYDQIYLREHRIGERMKPTFIQGYSPTDGIGIIDCEAYRSNPGPLYGILSVMPSTDYSISAEAVGLIDQYCREALNDSLTLGKK